MTVVNAMRGFFALIGSFLLLIATSLVSVCLCPFSLEPTEGDSKRGSDDHSVGNQSPLTHVSLSAPPLLLCMSTANINESGVPLLMVVDPGH